MMSGYALRPASDSLNTSPASDLMTYTHAMFCGLNVISRVARVRRHARRRLCA